MKKLLVLLVSVLILLTGCGGGSKTVITSDDFITKMSTEGFAVSMNEDYIGKDYILDARMAVKDDIIIEMVTYDSAESAEKVLEGHIDGSKARKSTAASEKKTTGENYTRYFLASNGYYIISSRIDNTLIFCITDLDSKETVDKAFESLGY